ncbi:MAG: HlyD family type I secretion periplasmic adaptor subunit [Paracoccaceae bacterium]
MTDMPFAGSSHTPLHPREDIGRTGMVGILASVGLLAIFVLWAQFTPISGAVVAPGQAIVPGQPRVVQSLDGGRISRIAVANGDRVTAGQVLLQLDPTLTQAKLDIARSRLASALALRTRLEAEQADLPAPVFGGQDLPFAMPDMRQAEAGQYQIFAARRAIMEGRHDQLAERVAQMNNQITGVEAQIAAREEQRALLERELASITTLFDKGMAREAQMLDLQRGRAGLMGEIAGLQSERARLENAIRDAGLEVEQARRNMLEEVATDLRATVTEIEELVLEILTLADQLARVDIRAPSDGMVHEMQVSTQGGVVAPGAVIMQIVPQTSGVEFEMRLPAQDLERVHVGQAAQLVFSSLDQRTTPRLDARVASVSPAAIADPQTGQNFYRLTLSLPKSELDRLGTVEVLPGMPVDAYLQTGDRSVMSYLLAPLSRQIMDAFLES